MERKVKCYGQACESIGKKWFKSQLIDTKGGKRYCEDCFEKLEKEREHRNLLYHFIEEFTHVTFPTGLNLSQIKRLREERNYTYFGMYKSLEYMVEVRHNKLTHPSFINYIPYVYDDAKQWYIDELTRKKRQARQLENQYTKQPVKIEFEYKPKTNKPKGVLDAEDILD